MGSGVVRLLPAGGVWVIPGVDVCPGVVPEQVRCTTSQWGPESLSFTLRRDTSLPWPDLRPGTWVDWEADGCGLVFGGRVRSAAPTGPAEWAVTCEGWQAHLDDDANLKRVWVHQRLGDWRPVRDWPGYATGLWGDGISASTGGRLTWLYPKGSPIPNPADAGRAGFFLDLGEAGAAARVVVTWTSSNNDANATLYLGTSDTDPSQPTYSTIATQTVTGASGTFAATISPGRRYLTLMCQQNSGAAYTPAAVSWFQVQSVQVFRSTAYESGNASILRASTVVADALPFAPLLDTSTAGIGTSGLIDAGVRGIPHCTTEGGYETPRQVITRANAYHDWLAQVTADRRLVYKARPTAPALEMGGWSGGTFQDAGDSLDELFNKVVVSATGLDGEPVQVTRTISSPILTLGGATRGKVLGAEAALTVAAAEVIGDAWLARRATRPTRGSVNAPGVGAIRRHGGQDITPAEALRYPGELLRLTDRVDPDTGQLGRDALITAVSYDADTDTAQLTLDAPLDKLDVILTRFGALAAVRPAA